MRKITILALRPSVFSSFVTLCVSLVVVGMFNWSFLVYSPSAYDAIFGDYGWITLTENSQGIASSPWGQRFLSGPLVYDLAWLFVSILAGLLAYVFVHSLRLTLQGVENAWQITHWRVTANQRAYTHTAEAHLAARLAIVVGWALYTLLFFTMLVPFCLLLGRSGADSFPDIGGITRLAGAVVGLMLLLHIHVLFARFALLRPRLFGGASLIEETLANEHSL